MRVAFIGLGSLGGPMALNLRRAGHRITGYDPIAPLPRGVIPAGSAAEAATGAEVVITLLGDAAALRQVAAEILPVLRKDAVFCDCSAVDVDTSREIAARAATAGIDWLDAPFSGGAIAAEAGTLNFMVGGSAAAFERIKPLLREMGRRWQHCGPAGTGQAARLCNNLVLGVTMIANCEAIALADRLGLSREAMFQAVTNSSGQSWALSSYCPAPGIGPTSPADNDYLPGYPAERMLADLDHAVLAAKTTGTEAAITALAQQLYRRFVEEEGGRGRDFSALLARFDGTA